MEREITEVAEGVYKLQFEIPYRVQPVNIYLLEGEPVTLVDAGPIMDEVKETIPRTLAELGHPPSAIERIVVTHSHPDHMGLAARFKAEGGGEVVCHTSGADSVGDYWGEFRRYQQYMVRESPYMGLDREMVASSFKASYQWNEVAEPVAVDRLVEDGETLPGRPHALRVIYTPGHSIDHICLYDPGERLLFSGDMLLGSITPNPDIYPPWQSESRSGLPDYIASLRKIRDIDARLALPGHGAVIEDLAARVDEVLRHHEQRLRFIAGLAEGREMTVMQMTFEMLDDIEAELTTENIFLGMREVFGHLEILEGEGRVSREMRGETAYYTSAPGPRPAD